MFLYLQLIFALLTLRCIQGFLVIAQNGSCKNKGAHAAFLTSKPDCDLMGGIHAGTAPPYCYIDMCTLPSTGPVSNKWIWVIDADQASATTSAPRTVVYVIMKRYDCDNLRGYPRQLDSPPVTNAAAYFRFGLKYNDTVQCKLHFKRVDGTDATNVDGIGYCGHNHCARTVAKGHVQMIHRYCGYLKGEWYGTPGAKDWIECRLDIAISPSINCKPSDSWKTIHTCINAVHNATFVCHYESTTGVSQETSLSTTIGASASLTLTTEASVQLMFVFAKLSASVTTGFHWEGTTTDTSIYSQSTTKSLTINVPPQTKIHINQVVGKCNDFHINTPHFEVATDSLLNKSSF